MSNSAYIAIATVNAYTATLTLSDTQTLLSLPTALSIGMENIDQKSKDNSTSDTNKSTPNVHTAMLNNTANEEEKYPSTPQFTEKEYATKRCIRPVRNNVFMEKSVEECDSAEINFEVERLICCLHFLSTEYNVYTSLKGYLDEIGTESKAEGVSSPYAFAHHRKEEKESRETQIAFNIKRSDTAHHIKWLHMAYVTEQSKRMSHKRLDVKHAKAPNFNNTIFKKAKLKQMYAYLRAVWTGTIESLTDVWHRQSILR